MENSQTEFTKSAHALIVGVGEYIHDSFLDLPAAERDAKAISAVLTDSNSCGYSKERVEVLIGENSTASNIREKLKNLSQATDSKSTVFVFFSGHGGRVLVHDAYRSYICPREADPDNLDQTAIPGNEFSDLLAAVPAQKMLVILDPIFPGNCNYAESVPNKITI